MGCDGMGFSVGASFASRPELQQIPGHCLALVGSRGSRFNSVRQVYRSL